MAKIRLLIEIDGEIKGPVVFHVNDETKTDNACDVYYMNNIDDAVREALQTTDGFSLKPWWKS